MANEDKHEQRLGLSQKKRGLFPDLLTDSKERNVGQQNSFVGVKPPFVLTLQASNRWCFNNKY